MYGIICLLMTALTPVLGGDILAVARANGCGKVISLIETAGLANTLKTMQGLTLFAPSDEAVARVPSSVLSQLQNNMTLLQDVLKFHVLGQVVHAADITNDMLAQPLFPGAKLRLNVYTRRQEQTFVDLPGSSHMFRNVTVITSEGAPVLRANLEADNGVVHVIDKVIYPLPTSNLPLTLTFDKDLGSLAFLIYQAKLIEALATEPFTVFAPSNEALDKLPGQVYNDLLMNLTRLREVLSTHVVKGVVFSAGLHSGQRFTNLQGTQLAISIGSDGAVSVNNSHVTTADTPASNAAIHVIDTVLMPH